MMKQTKLDIVLIKQEPEVKILTIEEMLEGDGKIHYPSADDVVKHIKRLLNLDEFNKEDMTRTVRQADLFYMLKYFEGIQVKKK